MTKSIVRVDSWDIDSRLADFDLSKEVLIDIVKASVSGQNGCTDNDPPGARGYESYRWGTRMARELLRQQGWEKDDTGGYATVINHDRKFRMVVMNADDGAGLIDRVPQNRCKKGAASERVANNNVLSLFRPEELPIPGVAPSSAADGYSTWHLCVYIKGETVRAELSLLSDFKNGFFTGFTEKIIVVGDGDWDELNSIPGSGVDDGPDFDVAVMRR